MDRLWSMNLLILMRNYNFSLYVWVGKLPVCSVKDLMSYICIRIYGKFIFLPVILRIMGLFLMACFLISPVLHHIKNHCNGAHKPCFSFNLVFLVRWAIVLHAMPDMAVRWILVKLSIALTFIFSPISEDFSWVWQNWSCINYGRKQNSTCHSYQRNKRLDACFSWPLASKAQPNGCSCLEFNWGMRT